MGALRLGIVGCGYWGPKVARAASSVPGAELSVLVDLDLDRAAAVARQFPGASLCASVGDALDRADAFVIATHPVSHVELTEQVLEAGKHALVEKPLALAADDCRRLGDLAAERGLVLMAGHTFLFSQPVLHVHDLIQRGELGTIYTIDSQRLNLGRVRQDVDAIWNFAPHDVSIVNFWLGGGPAAVSCTAHTYLQPGVSDVGFLTLEYPGGTVAHVHVSWLSPRKVRSMTVVGSKQMVVYDDTAPDQAIVLHDAGIDREHLGRSFPEFQSFGEFQLIQRLGDMHVPRLRGAEPLVEECRHFVESIQNGTTPRTDAESAAEVVAVLEAATLSAATGGARVELAHV